VIPGLIAKEPEMHTPTVKYDSRTVWLHWTTAILLVLLWGGAHLIDTFPKGPLRVNVRSLHILFGTVLVGLTIFRLRWRLTKGATFADPAGLGNTLAKLVHHLLYALIIVTLTLGIANAWVRGDDIFGLFHIPKFGSYDEAARTVLKHQILDWHELGANLVLGLGIGHGLVGLWHRLVLKDAVLQRMW
jgi:cytochrome b561